ncbi:MAG TPA: hypothetical protein VNL14_10995 [Candidatus Acidoferrales bacterium]|nr:hypothetical protein [Candidatus Acidoferrales bacterium]
MATAERDAEQKIERLAGEIGQVIRSAEPERQAELKELAVTLVREEVEPLGSNEEAAGRAASRAMNPLAAGLGLIVIGIGFSFVIPPVGLVLAIAGLVGVVWGSVMSWTKA